MRERAQGLELLLVGNPNAGKSTLFNSLTGGHAKVGNWHGVTVGELSKETVLGGERCLVTDLPGIYSTRGMSMEERSACEYIEKHPEALLVFVGECATLPRALPLFGELGKGRKCLLVLTKRRQFERAGGKIDADELSRILGIPVLDAEGFRGKRLKERLSLLLKDASEGETFSLPPSYAPAREGLSRADRWLLNGFFCIPLFFGILVFTFWVTFAPGLLGDTLKSLITRFFEETLGGLAGKISSPVMRSFLADGLLKSLGSVLCFLPQIVLLFFFLTVMEESGFLSRLAILTDGVFSKLGLNGRAVFSLLMGFGCSAAAILTTRGLDDKRIQRRVILCLPYISCSAKLPVYLTLASSFFPDPFLAVLLLYVLGVGLALFVAFFLKSGEASFVLELAPLQFPRPAYVVKALLFQVKQFIIKLGTVILAFFLASWLLSSFDVHLRFCGVEESILARLCGGLRFLFAPIGLGDWKIAYAALSGLIAKENVAGALGMFYGGFPFSAQSAFAFAVFILACSPCVSAIAASARELGVKSALLYAALQTGSAVLLSYLVYFLLTGGYVNFLLLLLPVKIFLLLGYEKIHRKRKHHPESLHG